MLRIADLSPGLSQIHQRCLVDEIVASLPKEATKVAGDAEADAYFLEPEQSWHRDWLARCNAERNGIRYFLDALPEHVVARIRERKSTLVVNGSGEGGVPWFPDNFYTFHEEIRQAELPFDGVIVVTGNSRIQAAYKNYFSEPPDVISVLYHNVYFTKGVRVLSEAFAPNYQELRDIARRRTEAGAGLRDFLCFNLAPRPHRVMLVASLAADDLLDRGLVSFPDLNGSSPKGLDSANDYLATALRTDFDAGENVMSALDRLRALGRMSIDEESVDHISKEYKIPFDAFARTWFSVVTETGMTGDDVGWITEKCLKPLVGFHPFVVLGSPHTLSDLRQLGFQTFQSVFDESYDSIVEPKKRFRAAYALVKDLAQREDKTRLIGELAETAEFNAHHALFNAMEAIRQQWTLPLADAIARRSRA